VRVQRGDEAEAGPSATPPRAPAAAGEDFGTSPSSSARRRSGGGGGGGSGGEEREAEKAGLLSGWAGDRSAPGRIALAYPRPLRLPYRFFFASPPFERRTFVRHLLCHLAAVVAWTGMWDLTDSIILPSLSASCYNVPGFANEYPCVLVKFAFVGLGAAGLHWTGQLYYGMEECVEGEAEEQGGGAHGRHSARTNVPWLALGLGGGQAGRAARAGAAAAKPHARRERLSKGAAALLARLRKRRTAILARTAGWRRAGGGGEARPAGDRAGGAAAAHPPEHSA